MNRSSMLSRNGICGVKFGEFLTFDRRWPSWILDKNQKHLHQLINRVKQYVHAKFCQNQMNRSSMLSRNGICGVKVGQLLTFDRWQPSWILERKQKRLHQLITRFKWYVHVKFCENQINGSRMQSRNGICGVKFGQFFTFDGRRPF